MSGATLAQLCEIRSGGTPLRSRADFYGGSIPWAKISDLDVATGVVNTTEESITEKGLAAIRGRLFKPGTLLFAIYGSIGKMAFAGQSISTNQAILGIEIQDNSRLDGRFLYHWLSSKADQFLRDGQGIAQKNLSAAYLRELPIPLLPLDEQRRIAAILDKADALRRKRKRALELLDGLTQAIVREAYRRVDATVSLGEYFDVQGGLQVSGARATLPLEAPYLRVANVYRSRLDLSEIKRMRVKSSELERTSLKRGDLLFVEGHGNADEVGRCAVWDASIDDCTHQNHIIRARPLSDMTDTVVLSQWLNGPDGRRHLSKRGKTTSGLNTISVSDVKSAPIPLLHFSDTERIRKHLDVIGAIRSQISSHIVAIDQNFFSLQHRAVSGQL